MTKLWLLPMLALLSNPQRRWSSASFSRLRLFLESPPAGPCTKLLPSSFRATPYCPFTPTLALTRAFMLRLFPSRGRGSDSPIMTERANAFGGPCPTANMHGRMLSRRPFPCCCHVLDMLKQGTEHSGHLRLRLPRTPKRPVRLLLCCPHNRARRLLLLRLKSNTLCCSYCTSVITSRK